MRCCILLTLVGIFLASNATAAEPGLPEQAPKTLPPDSGYGTQPVGPKAYFPEVGPKPGRVDRRGELNPLASRSVLWPTAHTPEQGSWTYSNVLFLGNQLSYAKSDDLLFTIGVVLPYEHTYGQGSAKWVFHRSRDLDVALVPFGVFRAGRRDFASSDLGAGAALVADLTPHDSLVLSAGVAGYGTLFYRYYDVDYSRCGSRSAYAEGSCLEGTALTEGLPRGGNWLAGYMGLTYYAIDYIFFNLELTYGATNGSFFGTETLLGSAVDRELEKRRYLDGEWGDGVPLGRGMSGAFGVTGVYRNMAAQFSIYMIRQGDGSAAGVEPLPVFSAAIQF